jgi:hypothetical protein
MLPSIESFWIGRIRHARNSVVRAVGGLLGQFVGFRLVELGARVHLVCPGKTPLLVSRNEPYAKRNSGLPLSVCETEASLLKRLFSAILSLAMNGARWAAGDRHGPNA